MVSKHIYGRPDYIMVFSKLACSIKRFLKNPFRWIFEFVLMVNIILVGNGCDLGGFFFGRQQKTNKMGKKVNGRLSIISYEINVKVIMNFIFEQMVCSGGN
jgi:hypothetical protein